VSTNSNYSNSILQLNQEQRKHLLDEIKYKEERGNTSGGRSLDVIPTNRHLPHELGHADPILH
jgi:hypothetical protein